MVIEGVGFSDSCKEMTKEEFVKAHMVHFTELGEAERREKLEKIFARLKKTVQ